MNFSGSFLFISMVVLWCSFTWFTFSDTYYMHTDKPTYTSSEKITGCAYINSTALFGLQKDKVNVKGTYGFYGMENAVGIIPQTKENKASYYSERYIVENAIFIKNDTAFFSFTLPASVRKCKQYQLQVHRTWMMKGRDTTFVARNIIDIIQ